MVVGKVAGFCAELLGLWQVEQPTAWNPIL